MDVYGSPTTIEIIRTCELNDAQLLFLSAVSSHVFQLLGMGAFATLKSKYRMQMANVAQRDDTTQTKKKHRNYDLFAHRDAYNLQILFSGRKAAGLLLSNPK
ncbi:hypothetical protein K3495_g8616 [Podosphaera aphanis]|nr:hypothetical protein K3495_g8616 [Podosphaera aphanis]